MSLQGTQGQHDTLTNMLLKSSIPKVLHLGFRCTYSWLAGYSKPPIQCTPNTILGAGQIYGYIQGNISLHKTATAVTDSGRLLQG